MMGDLYGIAGQKRHGKDTFARLVQEANPEFQITHFAKSLKRMANSIFGLTDAQMNDDRIKEARLERPIYMDDHVEAIRLATGLNIQPHGKVAHTPRECMQYFGTDFVRSVQDNYWIQQVRDEISDGRQYLIPDTRFLNEGAAIHGEGGRIVMVVRIDAEPSKDQHASETEMLKLQPDLVVGARTGDLSLPRRVAQCIAGNRWEEARLYDYREVPALLEASKANWAMRFTTATATLLDYYAQ